MAKTYQEIGKENGLAGICLARYCRYMKERWASTEEQKCSDGYAREWAERFAQGVEYVCSDKEGRRLLKAIYQITLTEEENV